MSQNPISEFAITEVAPLLLKPGVRERFLAQLQEYFLSRPNFTTQLLESGRRRRSLQRETIDAQESVGTPQELYECYANLAAVHDAFCKQVQPVLPVNLEEVCSDRDQLKHMIGWECQLDEASKLGESDLPDLKLCLHRVKADLDKTVDSDTKWMSFADAARISAINRGIISRAADAGKIRDNGKKGKGKRKIDSADFNRWVLERNKEQEESDQHVENLMKKHVKD